MTREFFFLRREKLAQDRTEDGQQVSNGYIRAYVLRNSLFFRAVAHGVHISLYGLATLLGVPCDCPLSESAVVDNVQYVSLHGARLKVPKNGLCSSGTGDRQGLRILPIS